MAVAVGILETIIPRPLPFIKPGLANIVTVVIVLSGDGWWTALRVNLMRCVLVALVTGTLATPSFLLSLSGGVSSALVMALLATLVPRFLSVTGLSVGGSAASLASQMAVASLLVPGLPLRALLPAACAWGIVSGTAVGLAAAALLRRGVPSALRGRLVAGRPVG